MKFGLGLFCISLVLAVSYQTVNGARCRNRGSDVDCKDKANNVTYCGTDHAKTLCKKACGLCSNVPHSCRNRGNDVDCKDKAKNVTYCGTDHGKTICKKACGLCSNAIPLTLCPTGFHNHKEVPSLCYKYVSVKATHSDAAAACTKMGAILAEPRSAEENDVIVAIVKKLAVQPLQVWLGATDVALEGTFVWGSDRKALIYTDWASGQPDDIGGVEHCLEYRPIFHGWNDWICSELGHYICQTNSIQETIADLKQIIDKQSNQISGLLATTEQLLTTTQEQQTRLDEQDKRINVATIANNQQFSAIKRLATNVFFTAVLLANDAVNISNGDTLVYNTVYNNVGGDYNSNTGLFTCRVPGYYQFTMVGMAFKDGAVRLGLYKNGIPKVIVDGIDGYYVQSGSNTAILLLAKNDVVSVVAWAATSARPQFSNTFSGFLLSVV